MEIQAAIDLARNLMRLHGMEHLNLVFYGVANPLGFCFRNFVGLSWPMVFFNSEKIVSSVILHELSHASVNIERAMEGLKPDVGHGQNWRLTAEWMQNEDPTLRPSYAPAFESELRKYRLHQNFRTECDTFFEDMILKIDSWIEADNPQGRVDTTTFLFGPRFKPDPPKSIASAGGPMGPYMTRTRDENGSLLRVGTDGIPRPANITEVLDAEELAAWTKIQRGT